MPMPCFVLPPFPRGASQGGFIGGLRKGQLVYRSFSRHSRAGSNPLSFILPVKASQLRYEVNTVSMIRYTASTTADLSDNSDETFEPF